MYKVYGKKFKQIRTQKRLPLSFFQQVGVDKSDLSKFERGKQMMGFERIDAMLQLMDVSLAEYELIINNFVPDFQEAFLNEIDQADFSQNINKLKSLYEEAQDSGYLLLALAAKSRFEQLNHSEIELVLERLYKVQEWGYFELSITYFVLDNLPTSAIQTLFNEFEQKNGNYYGIPKYSRRILQTAYRAIVILGKRKEKEFVNQIISATDKRSKSGIDIYIENLRRLTLGVNCYYFENQEQGLAQIDKALELFKILEHEELADYYTKKIKNYIQ